MKDERNALQRIVYPKLHNFCMQYGFRFQAIDLRWGISEEAVLDQKALQICLNEIDRCQKSDFHPNFIFLLGDKYGRCPLPSQIDAIEFESLLKNTTETETNNLKTWYWKDNNALSAVYCLQPRLGEFKKSEVWKQKEKELHSILRRAADIVLPNNDRERIKYETSFTHQEILKGVFDVPDAGEHVFGFLRHIPDLPHHISCQDFIDIDSNGRLDEDSNRRLQSLKTDLKEALPNNIYEYKAKWNGSGITLNHIDKLCSDVFNTLSSIILREISCLNKKELSDEEISHHANFGKKHFCLGRKDILQTVNKYIKGNSGFPLVVFGQSGVGKTALMAEAVKQAQKKFRHDGIVYRYIGATPASVDGRELLASLLHQIYSLYDFEKQKLMRLSSTRKNIIFKFINRKKGVEGRLKEIIKEYFIPGDFEGLIRRFQDFILKVPKGKKLILFLDALDQLSDADNANNLAWLPMKLPPNVRIIVSISEVKHITEFQNKLPEKNLVEIVPLSLKEGKKLLDHWLKSVERKLQEGQYHVVLNKFAGCGLPLYLKLAFEEARRWKSYSCDQNLGISVSHLIQDIFHSLSADANHGQILVSRCLGYLLAAKKGLTYDEILDLLSSDNEVYQDFIERAFHPPPEERLPVVVWSRLFYDLEPYLAERGAKGSSLLSFYHRQFNEIFSEIVLDETTEKKLHKKIADYFDGKALWIGKIDGSKIPNVRKVYESPYQLTMAGDWNGIEKILTDIEFIEAKCRAGLTYDLVTDYSSLNLQDIFSSFPIRTAHIYKGKYGVKCSFCQTWINIAEDLLGEPIQCPKCLAGIKLNSFVAKKEWPVSSLKTNKLAPVKIRKSQFSDELKVFNDFIRKKAHIIIRKPELFFQIAANEPSDSVLAQKARLREEIYSKDYRWLRQVNKTESSSPCLFTLSGHTDQVIDCGFSEDGTRITSISRDKMVKTWNTQTGEEILSYNLPIKEKILEKSFTFQPLRVPKKRGTSCSLSGDCKKIVVGLQSGAVQVWDSLGFKGKRDFQGFDENLSPWLQKLFILIMSICAVLLFMNLVIPFLRSISSFLLGISINNYVPRKFGNIIKGFVFIILPLYIFFKIGNATHRAEKTKFFLFKCTILLSIIIFIKIIGAGIFRHDILINFESFINFAWHTIVTFFDLIIVIVVALLCYTIIEKINSKYGKNRPECIFTPGGNRVVSTLCCCNSMSKKTQSSIRFHDLEKIKSRLWHEISNFDAGCVVLSPDERLIASASHKEIIIWDVSKRNKIAKISESDDSIYGCSFSPDGKWLISMHGPVSWSLNTDQNKTLLKKNMGNKVVLWDAVTGEHRAIFNVNSFSAFVCTFSPDGEKVVIGTENGKLELWDISTPAPQRIAKFVEHSAAILACAFSPNGRILVSASMDKTLKIWDTFIKEDKEEEELKTNYHYTFSPQGKVAVGAEKMSLQIWDSTTNDKMINLGENDIGNVWEFSPNGENILAGIHELKLFDTRGNLLNTFTKGLIIKDAHFSPDGTLIGVIETNKLIGFNQIKILDPIYNRIVEVGNVTTRNWIIKAVSSFGFWMSLFSGVTSYGLLILIAFLGTNESLWILTFILIPILFHINSKTADLSTILMILASSLNLGFFFTGFKASFREELINCSFSADSESLLIGGGIEPGLGVIFRLYVKGNFKGNYYPVLTTKKYFSKYVISPDNEHVLLCIKNSLELRELKNGKKKGVFENENKAFTAYCFSPDAKNILAGAWDGSLQLWDAVSGKMLIPQTQHDASVRAVCFSDCGKYFLTGADDGVIKLWNAYTGKEEGQFSCGWPIKALYWLSGAMDFLAGDEGGHLYRIKLENFNHE